MKKYLILKDTYAMQLRLFIQILGLCMPLFHVQVTFQGESIALFFLFFFVFFFMA